MNKVFLIGRMTSDPVLRYSDSQVAVLRFNVAIDRGRDKNGNDKGTDFPSVLAFGRTAENMSKFVGKGNRVAIEGHIRTDKHQNKNGDTVYTTDVIADRVEFIDWKDSGQKSDNPAPTNQGYDPYQPKGPQQMSMNQMPAGFEAISDDDVPF